MSDVKIVQILIAPDNSTWQGKMLGLGNDGIVYSAENDGWAEFMPSRFINTTTPKEG